MILIFILLVSLVDIIHDERRYLCRVRCSSGRGPCFGMFMRQNVVDINIEMHANNLCLRLVMGLQRVLFRPEHFDQQVQ